MLWWVLELWSLVAPKPSQFLVGLCTQRERERERDIYIYTSPLKPELARVGVEAWGRPCMTAVIIMFRLNSRIMAIVVVMTAMTDQSYHCFSIPSMCYIYVYM